MPNTFPTLSIIVPVFNKEEFIDDCIKSILNQTFSDLELILVNDGSTDESGHKCEYYKSIDRRIIVVHQANQGVSSARNLGLTKSRGSFIGFVDSDDVLEPDMYEVLIKNLLLFESDLSICGVKNNTGKNPKHYYKAPITYDKQYSMKMFLQGNIGMGVVNKLFKREIIKEIYFAGSMFEDVFYIFQVLLNSKKLVITQEPKYINITRPNSVSISKFNPTYFEITNITGKIVALCQEKIPEIIKDAQILDFIMNLSQLNLILLSGKANYSKKYIQTKAKLVHYGHSLDFRKRLKLKHRIAYILFRLSSTIYVSLLKLYCIQTNNPTLKRIERNTKVLN